MMPGVVAPAEVSGRVAADPAGAAAAITPAASAVTPVGRSSAHSRGYGTMDDVVHVGTPFGILVGTLGDGGAVVLSGAGLSTESGIPDYRGPSARARPAAPMTYQVFTSSAAARQRYWARSHLGWRHIAGASPNAGHRAVASLEQRGLVAAIITQNVDGLHQAAGAATVTELHGSLHRVRCLGCGHRTSRAALDERLRAANPSWASSGLGTLPPGFEEAAINPDGDVALESTDGFVVVDCLACGGLLKPDVVFFGESVPRPRVDACFSQVSAASSLWRHADRGGRRAGRSTRLTGDAYPDCTRLP